MREKEINSTKKYAPISASVLIKGSFLYIVLNNSNTNISIN